MRNSGRGLVPRTLGLLCCTRKRNRNQEFATKLATVAASFEESLCEKKNIPMWPNQGPPPPPPPNPFNPAYPPGYYPAYPTGPAPPCPAYPASPAPTYPTYPASPAPGVPPYSGQYPAGMNLTALGASVPPGVMPYTNVGPQPYPVPPCRYPGVPPAGVYPGPYQHPPKWGHHHVHHHGGIKPLTGGLMAMGMGLVGYKANKKLRKKMKKAHKGHKHWRHMYGKYSSSSSSDSD